MSSSGILQSLSSEIEQLAENVGRSVVGIGSTGRAGSGIIWDKKTIVTAYHVVRGLEEATIGTSDGKKLTAKVIGHVPRSDIAILKVEDGVELPPAIEKGDSDGLRVGQFVLALANPYFSRTSVTSGVVTGVNRTIGGWWGMTIENAVISDARVNPGYSGGPLVDASGRLIGLNVAYISSRGIAIPVNSITRAANRLSSGQPFKRAYLGIVSNPVPLPHEVSSDPRVGQDYGLMVLSVQDGTPAKSAGLSFGDVMLKFNGTSLTGPSDLVALLTEESIGRPANVLVLRGGKTTDLTVTPTGQEE